MDAPGQPSLTQGRFCILAAAVLWSLGGAFAKILTKETFLGLNEPPVSPLHIAFYRALIAGLVLAPMLRPRDFSFRWAMLGMVICFGAMNILYVTALALGTAASAILLQYTAPMWMYLASIWLLGERADTRSSVTLGVGIIGIALIVLGGWGNENGVIVAIGLASGLAYAGVLLFLRVLRTSSSRWLTVLNHLVGGLILLPWIVAETIPSWPQLIVLLLFGAVQMGLPYWLVARGLRSVSPQEAGAITLLEPILNPIWAYFVAGEQPSPSTFLGGLFIIGALLWRYWPFRLR